MKKIGLLFAVIIGLFVSRQVSYGQNDAFYYENGVSQGTTSEQDKTNLAKIIKTDNIDNNQSLPTQIRGFFKLNSDLYKKDPATAYVKMLINMALGFVSFIALILIIFAFYLILFNKGEDGVKKAKAIIKGVAIAIVVMGLSWLIVSFFFDLYSSEAIKNI